MAAYPHNAIHPRQSVLRRNPVVAKRSSRISRRFGAAVVRSDQGYVGRLWMRGLAPHALNLSVERDEARNTASSSSAVRVAAHALGVQQPRHPNHPPPGTGHSRSSNTAGVRPCNSTLRLGVVSSRRPSSDWQRWCVGVRVPLPLTKLFPTQ